MSLFSRIYNYLGTGIALISQLLI